MKLKRSMRSQLREPPALLTRWTMVKTARLMADSLRLRVVPFETSPSITVRPGPGVPVTPAWALVLRPRLPAGLPFRGADGESDSLRANRPRGGRGSGEARARNLRLHTIQIDIGRRNLRGLPRHFTPGRLRDDERDRSEVAAELLRAEVGLAQVSTERSDRSTLAILELRSRARQVRWARRWREHAPRIRTRRDPGRLWPAQAAEGAFRQYRSCNLTS
jgi:hypothetical protein